KRTITLVGAGGVGKTRLAIELAARRGHQFRDGVRVIDLAPVDDQAVAATIAAGLGLVRRAGRSYRDAIADWLRAKHVLVVIDNCEHVIDELVAVLADVSAVSGALTLLCTSRRPLGLAGEVVCPV